MAFKGSIQFVEILKRFIQDMPKKWIEFSDIYYNGKYITARQLLKSKALNKNYGSRLGLRLKKLEQSILVTVHEQRKNRMAKLKDFVSNNISHSYEIEEAARMLSIYESTALIKEIRKFTVLNCLELYKKLFHDKDYFYSLARGIDLPGCIEDIIGSRLLPHAF
jgi:DNA helicase-2/ATP-dependent DNA helicase PcrA